jgi:hypothetical protein
MGTKICSKCKEEKELCLFGVDKKRKDGLKVRCNDCRKIESLEYRKRNPGKRKETIKKYYENNKEKIKEKDKIRFLENPEKFRAIKLKSYHKNKTKDEQIERRRVYRKHKRKTDVKYRLANVVRRRIIHYIRINNITKKNKTFDIVGCTPQFLKEHLESQFKDGMSWDNYGFYGWHIDHIIPLSSAKTEEELYGLCHYTNLQPLWAKDNLSKGSKVL